MPYPISSARPARARRLAAFAALLGGLLCLAAPLAPAQARTTPAKVLKAGSRGDQVRQLQQALGVRVTGRYDAATARAVRAFQRREGLTVDGVAGPATRAALGVGTAPAAPVTPAGGTGAAAPAATDASVTPLPADVQATLDAIADCESGGDATAVSPSGQYRGKYQFSVETWAAMGGSGDPAAAPEAEQDQRAAALLALRGTAPWPACAAAV